MVLCFVSIILRFGVEINIPYFRSRYHISFECSPRIVSTSYSVFLFLKTKAIPPIFQNGQGKESHQQEPVLQGSPQQWPEEEEEREVRRAQGCKFIFF